MLTRDDVKAKIRERFKSKTEDRWGLYDFELEVDFLEPSAGRFDKGLGLQVKIAKMYRFDEEPFNFDDLAFLSELLGTRHINIGAEEHRGGCSTCDYGSRASISVFCSNVTTVEG